MVPCWRKAWFTKATRWSCWTSPLNQPPRFRGRPCPELADFGITAHRRSDFAGFCFLIPNFLNLPALPTQSLKRLFDNMVSSSNDQTPFNPLTIPMRWAQPSAESIIRILFAVAMRTLREFVTDLLPVFAAGRINVQSELRGQCDFSVRVASLSAVGFY